MVGYQAQKLLPTNPSAPGEDPDLATFESHMKSIYTDVKAHNPKTLLFLQLWLGTNGQTYQDMDNAFNGLQNSSCRYVVK